MCAQFTYTVASRGGADAVNLTLASATDDPHRLGEATGSVIQDLGDTCPVLRRIDRFRIDKLSHTLPWRHDEMT